MVKVMKEKSLSLLFIALVLSLMSSLSFAKTGKCAAYQNSISKAEVKANQRLSEGKARSASSQVKTFERTLRSYAKAECPDIDQYISRLAALKHRVDSAVNQEKCLGYAKKLDAFENDEVNRLIESGDTKSAVRLTKKYDKELKKYIKASCDNIDTYQKKATSYMATLNSEECNQDAQKMQQIEVMLNQLTAVKNPESPRIHRSNISKTLSAYTYRLSSFKKNQCAEDYTAFDGKVSRWEISTDPAEAYKVAVENDDVVAAELAINSGIDIHTSMLPLQWAIEKNAVDVVKYLVDQGVDLNAKQDASVVHPLNYSMDSEDKNIQLEMMKLLLTLGADLKQANSNRVIELVTQVGDLELLKKLEPTPLTVSNYATCYWRSELKQKELQNYCLGKIKSIGFDENWADQNEGMRDRNLSKEILRQGNAFVVGKAEREGRSPVEMDKVKIRSQDWTINRNSLGIILSREVAVSGLVKNEHGLCYIRGMRATQSYAGESYVSTPIISMLGKKNIDCD